MKIGLVGLGKMGMNLGLNMMDHGHQVTAYDVSPDAVERFRSAGGEGASSVEALVKSLETPRIVWLMVPQGKIVDNLLDQLEPLLQRDDIVIEAGNSHYKDSLRRAQRLSASGLHYFDVGTSGGMEGARHGACYMIGGDKETFQRIEPLFKDTAVPNGYLYTGPSGSGHYSKMVHNGIEYGMMAAIGEGFEILEKSQFDYDYEALAKVWSNGSVIRGWLMELTQSAFSKDPKLSEIRGVMHSSGEGKWTVEEALDLQAAAPIIALSLMMRYRSTEDDTFTGKVVAALRNEFGGHAVDKA
ncbi:phosphogluconate dehydrogenase (NAD(+)-dependent, decarboxylating) [Alicyclobacillus mengziensis]|uniref:Decarboxylating 6-phosphogluconate dehydrogenase n=1 Tax=Alicyclobacillus mengziensis TaxID=2931921 RepID=A0A9X7Z909_9BACL|nr:decarboxylating 6-phosphogluconate dehydrogenase [Alicyclobacillus mengziensis]QSO49025.1 decarboxylating 6-phosphogluconate dehydrogenase [Alicyclobacillus mengziensis]